MSERLHTGAGSQRVRVAEHAGFCFGVQRAMEIALQQAGTKARIYALGPLIHNRQAVRRLEELGVRSVERVEEAVGGVLLIRTHGVPSRVIMEADALGVAVVDTTCPFVRRVHERARSLLSEGYEIVIVGEHDHPEIIGIMGQVADRAHIVERPDDVLGLPPMNRVGVVSQTTQTADNLALCVGSLLLRSREVKAYNTLCDATTQRQGAAADLAREASVMLVVGGYDSGNTRRLAEICANVGTPTHHIETASELRPEWLACVPPDGFVGVTAGASTPDWVIREVVASAEQLLGA